MDKKAKAPAMPCSKWMRHKWTDVGGVQVTAEADGEVSYSQMQQCVFCGGTRTKVLKDENEEE